MAQHNTNTNDDSNCRNCQSHLLIEDTIDDDSSIVRISSKTMDKLELFCGDTVKLKGRKQRETICIVLFDDSCSDDCIRVHQITQNNLRVRKGDTISIEEISNVKCGTHIHVLPVDDMVIDTTENLVEDYLRPYFNEAYRPISVGDNFIVRKETRSIEFKVVKTEPNPWCIVTSKTVIDCEGEPVQREEKEIRFVDIGGMKNLKQELKEYIEFSSYYEKHCHKFGMKSSHGLLLFGPPGCGKTMLVKALANECDINFIHVQCAELLVMTHNDDTHGWRTIFDKARQSAPCLLFINALDCICQQHDNDMARTMRIDRLLNQLLTELDGLNSKSKVFIIAETNRPDRIYSCLLKIGRFDQKLCIPLPDEKDREDILNIQQRLCPVAQDVDLHFLAKILIGVTGADIIELYRRAYKALVREMIENERNMVECLSKLQEIRRVHFEEALKSFRPSISSNADDHLYEKFRQMWQSPYQFISPINMNDTGFTIQIPSTYTDDDDLYA